MNETLTRRQQLMVSVMLFGMFFGAGNLIFPPFVGKNSGNNMWITMAFFCVTAVILPIMGVIAVSKAEGLKNLGNRVGTKFSSIYSACIYLSIGPLLAIPRAGSIPYEMVIKPYLPEAFSGGLALFLYTVVFFGIAYWLVLSPNKLVERIGRFITPTLLILLGLLFVVAIVRGMPEMTVPLVDKYNNNEVFSGFIDGYLTMDTLAALNFGVVIAMVIRNFNVKQEKNINRITIKAGLIAGVLLAVIYFGLAYLGATTATMFPDTTNGAQILSEVSTYLLGKAGAILIGIVFTIACLTVSVGLITSSGKFFAEWMKEVSYLKWVTIWTVLSLIFSNLGLDLFLKYNIAVLFVLYPMSIVLIVLALLNRWMESNKWIYRSTVIVAGVISVVKALDTPDLNVQIPVLQPLFSKLPLYNLELGWVIPVFVVLVITFILKEIGITADKKKA